MKKGSISTKIKIFVIISPLFLYVSFSQAQRRENPYYRTFIKYETANTPCVSGTGDCGTMYIDGNNTVQHEGSTSLDTSKLYITQEDEDGVLIQYEGYSNSVVYDTNYSLCDADYLELGTIKGVIKIYIKDSTANGITDGVYYIPFYSASTFYGEKDFYDSFDYRYVEGGSFFDSEAALHFGTDVSGASNLNIGIHFESVMVDQGVQISSAIITMMSSEAAAVNDCKMTIYAEDAASPTTPTNATEAHTITLTSASIAWGPIEAFGIPGTLHETPEIKTVIQEVLDRSDWVKGGTIHIQMRNNASDANAKRHCYSDDYMADPNQWPVLTIIKN